MWIGATTPADFEGLTIKFGETGSPSDDDTRSHRSRAFSLSSSASSTAFPTSGTLPQTHP